MSDRVTVWECATCEARGRTPDTIRHVITCSDPHRARSITFELGDGPAPPLF